MADAPLPLATTPNTLRWHVRRTLVLAWPVILSRVGVVLMSTMDVVVVGRAGAQELAYYVLGFAVIDSLVAVMAGLQLGVPVLAARSIGEGRPHLAAVIWRRGLLFSVIIGLAAAIAWQGAPWFFTAMGQEEDLARGGGAVSALLAFSLPFIGLYLVSATLLEALEKPFHATIAVFIANGVNLVLSIIFVFGFGPIPAMGAWGCALATVITSALLGFGLAGYVRFLLPDRQTYGFGVKSADLPPPGNEQRKLGYAAGASYGLEAAAFAGITVLAGLLGVIGLAAMGVLFQLFAITFMISFGIAGATQVRVGNAWGRQDARGMVQAGWAGFGLSLVASGAVSVLFVLFPEVFIRGLTNDQAVIAAALPVMIWMVMALLADGGQTVLNHACRGRGDTWIPTSLHMVSYWFVMLPLAWFLALHLGGGAIGLYQAILISSLISLIAMGGRFALLLRRGLPAGPQKV
ncbi:MAG: MATE family efflux transporter [Hyphomicrobiales bacterium]